MRHPASHGILRSPGFQLGCILVLLLAGCSAKVTPKPPGPEEVRARKPPPAPQQPRPLVPRADQLGPVMDTRVWKIQCSNENLAMMCRRSDPTDRRCAGKKSGKYRWTYGSYCKRVLPCGKRACR
jgi:hypothetical protein